MHHELTSTPISPFRKFKLGDKVEVDNKRFRGEGVVRFVGATKFKPGDWVGVALDIPMPEGGGNHGSVDNESYFKCTENHGIFVRPATLRLVQKPDKPSIGVEKPDKPHSKLAAPLSSSPSTLHSSLSRHSKRSSGAGGSSGGVTGGSHRSPIVKSQTESASSSPMMCGIFSDDGGSGDAPAGLELGAGDSSDFIRRLLRFLTSQDLRVSRLEDRARLHPGEEGDCNVLHVASSRAIKTDSAGSSKSIRAGSDGVSKAVRNIEERLLQHEADLKRFGGIMEKSASQIVNREVERRLAFAEGRLDALWNTLQGERLVGAFGTSEETKGSHAQGGDDARAHPGRHRGSPSSDPVMSHEDLRGVFDHLKDTKSGEMSCDRVGDFFAELGFEVQDASDLHRLFDRKKTGKVSFQALLNSLEVVQQPQRQVRKG